MWAWYGLVGNGTRRAQCQRQLLQPLFATPGVEFWNLQGGSIADRSGSASAKRMHLHAAEECANSVVQFGWL